MSGTKQLPLELIHHIVEPLAQRDASGSVPPALVACSLVSRTWNHICRLHIFHTIVLASNSLPARLSFLHFKAPHLSQYVLNLHISLHDRNIRTAKAWFPDCLKRLKNLRVLRIENFIFDPPALRGLHALGIMSVLATARIKQLDLVCWDEVDSEDEPALLTILSACSSTLEKLSLQILERADLPTIPERIANGPRTPLTVCLNGLRELKILEVFPRFHRADHLECPHLEHLRLEHRGHGPWQLPSYVPVGLCELVIEGAVLWTS